MVKCQHGNDGDLRKCACIHDCAKHAAQDSHVCLVGHSLIRMKHNDKHLYNVQFSTLLYGCLRAPVVRARNRHDYEVCRMFAKQRNSGSAEY